MDTHETQSGGWHVKQRASEAYEQYLVPPLFAPWADRILEASEIHNGDRLLDVGCGTGVVGRRAAPQVGEQGTVVGIDRNQEMLAVAVETAGDSQPSIQWRQGDATDLPFPDGSFDVVCCQQALQFFDDPEAALRQMHRVCTPGGRVAVSVWRPIDFQPAYVALADALEAHVSEAAGTMMRSPFPPWDGEHLRTLAQDAGFDDLTVTIEIGSVRYPSLEEFLRREAASSPLADSLAAVERERREELLRALEDALGTYLDDDGIVSPIESYVVIADR